MPQKPKRPSPLDDPPTASSSSDSEEENEQPLSQQPQHNKEDASSEETEGDDEETEEEEEEEEEQPSHIVKPIAKIPPPTTKPSSSSSESDSDSGSDSEHDQPKVKPLASKPMDHTPKSKPNPSSSAPNRSASKRPGENNGHVSDPKRAKKKVTGDAGSDEENEEDGKKTGVDPKNPFKRVFSEEDELAILKGIAEFTSKTGLDPLKNGDAFHDFVKKTIRVDAKSNQLKQKIQRLRKKFNNAAKGKNGEAPRFSKPHDQKSFDLSKKIWGNEKESNNGVVEKAKSNGKAAKSPKKESSAKNVATPKQKSKSDAKGEQKLELQLPSMDSKESGKVDEEKHDTALALSSMIRFGKGLSVSGLDEDVAKKGIELMEASKRAELEGKWRKLQDAEMELYVKHAELVAEQARLILQAYRSSKN